MIIVRMLIFSIIEFCFKSIYGLEKESVIR